MGDTASRLRKRLPVLCWRLEPPAGGRGRLGNGVTGRISHSAPEAPTDTQTLLAAVLLALLVAVALQIAVALREDGGDGGGGCRRRPTPSLPVAGCVAVALQIAVVLHVAMVL